MVNKEALVQRWVRRIGREKAEHKDFRRQAKRAVEAYLDESVGSRDPSRKPGLFPVWWSTAQILQAAIFAKPPKPDVRKRYSEAGQSNDRIAQSVQRSLEYTLDTTDFMGHADRSVNDFIVASVGQARLELDTKTEERPVLDPLTTEPMLEDGEPLLEKVIVGQKVRLRHFSWDHFGWEPGKDWERVDWIYFVHDMSHGEIKDQFDVDIASLSEKGSKKDKKDACEVWEIWDRKRRERLFIAETHPEPLEVTPDPLGLEDFYPCPRPMFLNLQSGKLVPKPDYSFIESQCDNINRLTGRIHAITAQVKDVGFYDQSLQELSQLMNATDGTRIPIKNLLERLNKAQKASFEQVLAIKDNTPTVAVLRELIANRDIEKNVVFETIGISDIVRGASEASETLGAQQIKAQWANVRIGPKIKAVSMWCRDVFRIMSELISEHFEKEQIDQMTGMQLTDEEFAVLQSDLARCYAIDIETDSTLAQDDAEERSQRLEAVKAMSDYLGALLPVAQQLPADLIKNTLLFVVRSFKYGHELEESIDQMSGSMQQLQQLQQQAQQMQQQMEQMGHQNQGLQQELQKAQQSLSAKDQAEAQAKVIGAQSESKLKDAQTQKTQAETDLLRNQAGAESGVIDASNMAQAATQAAAMGLQSTMQQLAEVLPVLQEAAIQFATPKTKRGAAQKQPDGSWAFAVEEA